MGCGGSGKRAQNKSIISYNKHHRKGTRCTIEGGGSGRAAMSLMMLMSWNKYWNRDILKSAMDGGIVAINQRSGPGLSVSVSCSYFTPNDIFTLDVIYRMFFYILGCFHLNGSWLLWRARWGFCCWRYKKSNINANIHLWLFHIKSLPS